MTVAKYLYEGENLLIAASCIVDCLCFISYYNALLRTPTIKKMQELSRSLNMLRRKEIDTLFVYG